MPNHDIDAIDYVDYGVYGEYGFFGKIVARTVPVDGKPMTPAEADREIAEMKAMLGDHIVARPVYFIPAT